MCKGTNCPYKENCYRYTAKPSEYQSWFMESPIGENGKCDLYWGENSQSIMNQLEEILKPKNNE